jgi:formylglycine-generating enzyme required for sulfatase activity
MDKVLEIGINVATPLGLAGLFAAVVFVIARTVITQLLPTIQRANLKQILRLVRIIIDRLTLLAIVAMCLGLVGYIIMIRYPPLQAQMDDLRSRIEKLEKASIGKIADVNAVLEHWATKYHHSPDDARQIVSTWAARVMREGGSQQAMATARYLQNTVVSLAVVSPPPLENRIVPTNGMVLLQIPKGTFTMGSPVSEEGREADEGPQTQVTFDYDFWIGKYELTQAEYDRVRTAMPSLIPDPSTINGDRTHWGLPNYGVVPERPVENITWFEADAFCRALTRLERRNLPANYVYRLPTEAEWEYACRAETTTRFSFGDDAALLGEYAWFGANCDKRTQPVGRKLPNAWGLYDMSGNVMEWCLDWYQPHLPGGSVIDPVGPPSGTKRVMRGGGWASDKPREFRCADRWGLQPSRKGWAYGLRVVLGPSIDWLRRSH